MRTRQTLILLVLAYVAATWLPEPGIRLRSLSIAGLPGSLSQWTLAGLLFSAGVCSSQDALQRVLSNAATLARGLTAVWLLTWLAGGSVAAVLWALGAPAQVCLGVVIVAAMPVANSSVGWSSYLGGNVGTSVALLVSATALSPVLSSIVITIGATCFGDAVGTSDSLPWAEGMSGFFLSWVLIPVLLGVAIAGRLHESQSRFVTPIARRASFTMLIFLNYLNGTTCLPVLVDRPAQLAWPLLGAALLLAFAFAFGHWIRKNRSATVPELETNGSHQMSLELAILLRNTGAALVFAGTALPGFVLVSITIIAYTMLQHLFVGFWIAPHVLRERLEAKRERTPAAA